jgi:hypothetical protein
MREDAVPTLEELIARRDAVIAELQGEWAIDRDMKSLNRKAIRLGGIIFVAGMAFALVLFPIIYVTAQGQQKVNMRTGLVGFGLMMLALMAIFAGIAFCCVHIQAWWYRRFDSIFVDGRQLVWDKRKGHIPEALSLHGLNQVACIQGGGQPGHGLFMKLMGSSAKMISKHMLISPGEHNTPKFTPAMFIDGDQLIGYLEQVAEINAKIKELDDSVV